VIKPRRRVLLKGFRASLWTTSDKPKLGELARMLLLSYSAMRY
jgi:hypothetical protein